MLIILVKTLNRLHLCQTNINIMRQTINTAYLVIGRTLAIGVFAMVVIILLNL